MRPLAALAAAAVMFAPLAALADPVGRYNISGTNPGNGSAYNGTVSVERTGETYRVIWRVGSTRYFGTGIGNKDFLAVSYRSGRSTGIALYGPAGDGWAGVWTYADGRDVGSERWKRQ